MKRILVLSLALMVPACDSGPTDSTNTNGTQVLEGEDNNKGDEFFGGPHDMGTSDDATSSDGDIGWEDDWEDDWDVSWSDAATGPSGDAADGPEEADPWAPALDVTLHRVEFDEDLVAASYSYPSVSTGFSLGGTEFWQKWQGGKNPTYQFGEGSEYGKRCMVASAKRFEAIMEDAPQIMKDLKQNSNWGGSFFNWNDDFSQSDWGDGNSARLWAWRTTLIKWISQTNKDGSCYLPTLEMVQNLGENCSSKAESNDGEIVGCKNY